jgi:hypothetical protein
MSLVVYGGIGLPLPFAPNSLSPKKGVICTQKPIARLPTAKQRASKASVAAQIGNAVPPLLAYHLGLAIANMLTGNLVIGADQQISLFAGL